MSRHRPYYGPGAASAHPGITIMGRRWPDEVRVVLERMVVVPDLLLTQGVRGRGSGFYSGGVVEVGDLRNLDTIVHEICHAHQDARTDGLIRTGWGRTPEGAAFREARRADWDTVGRAGYDAPYSSLHENGAETCGRWWDIGGTDADTGWPVRGLANLAPNRWTWADEWLTRP